MKAINYYISYIYDINYRLEYKANNRKYPKLFLMTDYLDNFGYIYKFRYRILIIKNCHFVKKIIAVFLSS
jgi:hypothetical protein